MPPTNPTRRQAGKRTPKPAVGWMVDENKGRPWKLEHGDIAYHEIAATRADATKLADRTYRMVRVLIVDPRHFTVVPKPTPSTRRKPTPKPRAKKAQGGRGGRC